MRTFSNHKKRIAQLSAGLVCGALLGYAEDAKAFTRTLGCNAEGDVCSELFWPTNCATYLIEGTTIAASGLSQADLQAEIDASFAVWNDNINTCSYLTLTSGGLANGLGVGFDNDGEEDNVITFVGDGWLELGAGHDAAAIALTSVFFDPNTGVIVNADMEFNAEFFRPMIIGQTISDPLDQRVEADVRNTITHEAGHFLGLDHTNISDATMFAVAETGETLKQTIAQDDVQGLCAIYPVAEDPEKCKPAGFIPRNRIGDCSIEQGSSESNQSLFLISVLFGLSLVVLSYRRRS